MNAEILSYIAAFGCIIMAIPPVLIGAIAKSTGRFVMFMPFMIQIAWVLPITDSETWVRFPSGTLIGCGVGDTGPAK